MILSLAISTNTTITNSISGKYEFDNRMWSMIAMNWETINDTWEQEI